MIDPIDEVAAAMAGAKWSLVLSIIACILSGIALLRSC